MESVWLFGANPWGSELIGIGAVVTLCIAESFRARPMSNSRHYLTSMLVITTRPWAAGTRLTRLISLLLPTQGWPITQ